MLQHFEKDVEKCHHEFPAKLCWLPTHVCPLHVVLMKVDERAINDASWCMHD
jgi:hypothetical protein